MRLAAPLRSLTYHVAPCLGWWPLQPLRELCHPCLELAALRTCCSPQRSTAFYLNHNRDCLLGRVGGGSPQAELLDYTTFRQGNWCSENHHFSFNLSINQPVFTESSRRAHCDTLAILLSGQSTSIPARKQVAFP